MKTLLRIIIVVLTLTCIVGCKTSKVTTESIYHDTLIVKTYDTIRDVRYSERIDTFVYEREVYVELDSNGNEKTRKEFNNRYRSTTKKDSTDFYKSLVDSIKSVKDHKDKEVIEVEKSLSWLDRIRIKFFDLMVVFFIVFILVICVNKKLFN